MPDLSPQLDELNHACLIDGARLSRADVLVCPYLFEPPIAAHIAAREAGVKIDLIQALRERLGARLIADVPSAPLADFEFR